MSKVRQQRTAEQIKLLLSELFLRQLRDPRLHGLTITDVTIDRELRYADIYVNALGADSRQKEVMAALAKAVPFVRRELANHLHLRAMPALRFHWDPVLARAEQLHIILDHLEIPDEEE